MHPMCTEACTFLKLLFLCLVQAGSLLGVTLTEIQSYSLNGQAAQLPASVFNLTSELPLGGRRLLGARPEEPGLGIERVRSGRQLLDGKPQGSGSSTQSQDAGRELMQPHHAGHADSSKAVSHRRDKADQALAIDAASSVVPDDAEVTERTIIMTHCDQGHFVVRFKGLGSTLGSHRLGLLPRKPTECWSHTDHSKFAGLKLYRVVLACLGCLERGACQSTTQSNTQVKALSIVVDSRCRV